MMKSVLGEAAQLADYDTVRNRMKSSRYMMDFLQRREVRDGRLHARTPAIAVTAATLMKAFRWRGRAASLEKSALDMTTIDSNAGTLTVSYASTDSQFASLLSSPLFQSVVK